LHQEYDYFKKSRFDLEIYHQNYGREHSFDGHCLEWVMLTD